MSDDSINALYPTGLSRIVRNILWSAGIRTVSELRRAKDARLLDLPHFGPKSLSNARAALAAYVAAKPDK